LRTAGRDDERLAGHELLNAAGVDAVVVVAATVAALGRSIVTATPAARIALTACPR
jgi:hypothetical protein